MEQNEQQNEVCKEAANNKQSKFKFGSWCLAGGLALLCCGFLVWYAFNGNELEISSNQQFRLLNTQSFDLYEFKTLQEWSTMFQIMSVSKSCTMTVRLNEYYGEITFKAKMSGFTGDSPYLDAIDLYGDLKFSEQNTGFNDLQKHNKQQHSKPDLTHKGIHKGIQIFKVHAKDANIPYLELRLWSHDSEYIVFRIYDKPPSLKCCSNHGRIALIAIGKDPYYFDGTVKIDVESLD